MNAVRVGTRGSALALVQAGIVKAGLERLGVDVELVIIQTIGDGRPPDTAWGEGAFVSAIEDALSAGSIDVAVHSAKDIPTAADLRLLITAYLPRDEPRDALVVRATTDRPTLATLPPGSVIGTDSPRRTGFLRAYRGDLVIRPLHGNVDTRLRRLDDGEVDALVLAAVGLNRLGRGDRIAQLIPPTIVPPAPGQGALAVQARAGDARLVELTARLDDRPTRLAVEAERAFLAATGGGCRAPIGALATIDADGSRLTLMGGFATTDGSLVAFDRAVSAIDAGQLAATDVASRLVARRAELTDAPRVLVCRPAERAARLTARLVEHGIAPLVVPTIAIELSAVSIPAPADYALVVATSANAVRAIRAVPALARALAAARWAAIGDATAREISGIGGRDVWQPSLADGQALARELPLSARERVLLLAGSLSDGRVAAALRARGAEVDVLTVYRTIEGPESSRAALHEALASGQLAGVIVASPSQVRGLLALADAAGADRLRGLPFICIGASTAAAARQSGFHSATTSSMSAEAVAALAAATIARQRMEAHA